MANTNNARKTFTDLSNPQQLRELNRQLEWVWNQLLGGLSDKAFSNIGIKSLVKTVEKTVAQEIEADEVTTNVLKAALSEMMVALIAIARIDLAQIVDLQTENLVFQRGEGSELYIENFKALTSNLEYADIDFSKIKDLLAGDMIFTAGKAGELYIERLAATSAMMLSATLGRLVIQGEDGEYYEIAVSSDGTIHTSITEVTEEDIAAGETPVGKPIISTSAVISDLNAQSIKASSGIIDDILTVALSAGKITAAEAMLSSATIPTLYTTSLKALAGSLNLSANDSVKIMVGSKGRIFRSESAPEGADVDDLWVQPSTGYVFQCIGDADSFPGFYMDAAGNLYYKYSETQEAHDLIVDENGDMYLSADAISGVKISEDGKLSAWVQVRDSGLEDDIAGVESELETKISGSVSELTLLTDELKVAMSQKVDSEELRTYMRYKDGTLELGRSDSRYTTRTSSNGFIVLQDGVPMTMMEQNTVSAPVVNARRMFTLGNHGAHLSATGHLIFN